MASADMDTIIQAIDNAGDGAELKSAAKGLAEAVKEHLDDCGDLSDAAAAAEDLDERLAALETKTDILTKDPTNGAARFSGDVYANGNKQLATKEYVDEWADDFRENYIPAIADQLAGLQEDGQERAEDITALSNKTVNMSADGTDTKFAGDVYANSSKKLATEEFVVSKTNSAKAKTDNMSADGTDTKFTGDVYANNNQKLATETFVNTAVGQVRNKTDAFAKDAGGSDVYFAGDVYANGSEQLATKTFVNDAVGQVRNKTDLVDIEMDGLDPSFATRFPGDVYANSSKKLATEGYADADAEEADARMMGVITGDRLLEKYCSRETVTGNGVTFTWVSGDTLDIHRASGTGEAYDTLLPFAGKMPWWMAPGKNYLVRCGIVNLDADDTVEGKIHINFGFKKNTAGVANSQSFTSDGILAVPESATDVRITVTVLSEAPEHLHVRMRLDLSPEVRFGGDVYANYTDKLATEEYVKEIVGSASAEQTGVSGGSYTWVHGGVSATGDTGGNHDKHIITTEYINMEKIWAVRYTGKSVFDSGALYGCYLVEYDAAKSFIGRKTLRSGTLDNGTVLLDAGCAFARFYIASTIEMTESEGDAWACDLHVSRAAELGDDISDLSARLTELKGRLFSGGEISGRDYEWEHGSINGTTGKELAGNDRIRTVDYIPVNGIRSLTYTGETVSLSNKPYGCYVAQYAQNGGGYNFIRRDAAYMGGAKTVVIADGCTHVRLTMVIGDGAAMAVTEGDRWLCDANGTNVIDELETAVAKAQDGVDSLSAGVFGVIDSSPTFSRVDNMAVDSRNTGSSALYPAAPYFFATSPIALKGAKSIEYTRVVTVSSSIPRVGIGFYKDAESTEFVSGVPARKGDHVSWETAAAAVPDGANYVRLSWWMPEYAADKGIICPEEPTVRLLGSDYDSSLSARVKALETNTAGGMSTLGLHDKVSDPGVLNVVRRARQLTDVEWTPAVDLPRMMMLIQSPTRDVGASSSPYYLGVFKAGVTYKGIPYIRTQSPGSDYNKYFKAGEYGRSHLYVGHKNWGNGGVDIGTFVTAVENKNSRLCNDYNVSNEVDANGDPDVRYNPLHPMRHNPLFLGCVCSVMGSHAYQLGSAYTSERLPFVQSGSTYLFTGIPSETYALITGDSVCKGYGRCVMTPEKTWYINPDNELVDRDGETCSGDYAIGAEKVTIDGAEYPRTPCDAVRDMYDPANGTYGLDAMAIGDLINGRGIHTALCTDLQRDADGHVIYVEVSESTPVGPGDPGLDGGPLGGLCRRKGFTVEDFAARFGRYNIYRYDRVGDVTYTPSPYVNVGDEYDWLAVRDKPVIPWEGDGFVYKRRTDVTPNVILSPDNGVKLIFSNEKTDPWHGGVTHPFSHIRLWKDGEASAKLIEIDGGDTDKIVTLAQLIDWFGGDGTGTYRAALTLVDGDAYKNTSAKCVFEVE